MKQVVGVACCGYASSTGASLENIEQHTDKQLKEDGVPWLCRHHHDRVKKLVVEPGNPHVIVSCGEDGVGAALIRRVTILSPFVAP